MPRYQIKVTVDAAQERSVVKKLRQAFGKKEAEIFSVEKLTTPAGRSARLQEGMDLVEEGKAVAEELRDELQEWRDNLPENLQDGNKASELDDAISELETIISDLEKIDGSSVTFPGIMG